mmetsp:Transcript_31787/g.48376  ORF Transcript_31787/g.48376 Transcript_31787/m.48376 type:complete len:192 (-) Transcript_31787:145-720(-)
MDQFFVVGSFYSQKLLVEGDASAVAVVVLVVLDREEVVDDTEAAVEMLEGYEWEDSLGKGASDDEDVMAANRDPFVREKQVAHEKEEASFEKIGIFGLSVETVAVYDYLQPGSGEIVAAVDLNSYSGEAMDAWHYGEAALEGALDYSLMEHVEVNDAKLADGKTLKVVPAVDDWEVVVVEHGYLHEHYCFG